MGARVLTRTMKKVEKQAGKLKRKVRDRTLSVNKRVFAIALSARHKGNEGEERRKKLYRQLLRLSRQIVNERMKRWVGLGGLANNLINIGTALAAPHA